MGKHRKSSRRRALVPAITTGLAVPVAGALAAVYATNPTIAEVGLAADHTIFVDGTRSPFLTDRDNLPGSASGRLKDSFDSRYANDPDPQFVDYPGTLGIVSILSDGLGAPTFDESEQVAVDGVKDRVDGKSGTVLIIGYSQGASAVVRAIDDLEQDAGYDGSRVTVILAANPRRNDGGLLTRLPNFTLPLVGATFGEGTDPQETRIIQVTKQYDGVADAPVYVLNPLADVNAILGYVYLHNGYYQDVTFDPENPPTDDTVVVTTSPNGKVTDILVRNQPGQLPLTQPLRSLGVPDDVIKALDPFLRAVIETGYDRPAEGEDFPDEPVRFKLLPGPDQWADDAQSVAAGAAETVQRLGSLGSPSTASQNTDGARTASPAGVSPDPVTIAAEKPDTAEPKKAERKKDLPGRAGSDRYRPGDVLRSVNKKVRNALSSVGPKRADSDESDKPRSDSDSDGDSSGGDASSSPKNDSSSSTP